MVGVHNDSNIKGQLEQVVVMVGPSIAPKQKHVKDHKKYTSTVGSFQITP